MKLSLSKRIKLLNSYLQRYLSRKISSRLIFSYIGLGAVPLLIVSLFLISLTQETVQNYIYERNMETARRASNEIFLFIKAPLTILQTTSLTRDVTEENLFIQRNLINRLKDENPIFRELFLMNEQGIVTVTTRFGEEMKFLGNEPFFEKAMRGEEFFSDVYFTPSRFPVLLIAEPIKKFNQVAGVLAAEIELNKIWDLVDNITIEKSGIAFLLSAKGQVIAHKNKEKVYVREDYSNYPFFRELKAEKSGFMIYEIDNEDKILVYVPVPQLKWGIVVQQSHREALTLARQMRDRVVFFVLLTTVIAVVLGVLGVQRFTKPLVKLVNGVREYGRGNLKHRIEMPTHDELAELAQEFNSMAESLLKNQKELQRMERLAALSRFAASISHEIRNPLNSMNINMQMLKRIIYRTDIARERKEKYFNVLSSEITRINDMVTNFLTIARPPELNLVRMDIHQILDEVIMVQEARAISEGITIKTTYLGQGLSGMFDYNQLKQVFHNLIVNAFEAMKEGGILLIKTSLVKKSESENVQVDYVRIQFKDNGEGIPREILKEVFDFYYTSKRAGTGLGLAIAKQIIEAHKGIVYIESERGIGTSVYIELPSSSREKVDS